MSYKLIAKLSAISAFISIMGMLSEEESFGTPFIVWGSIALVSLIIFCVSAYNAGLLNMDYDDEEYYHGRKYYYED